MRTASTTLLVIIALVVALASAWGAHRQDARLRRTRPASSPRCLAHLEALQSSSTADSTRGARAARLREHIDECRADPLYVEQLIRELLEIGELSDAKSLFETARRERVFAAAESEALEAWIALAEVRIANSEGRVDDAARARAQAKALATRLSEQWPEWAVPALLLLETERSADAPSTEGTIDYLSQLRQARRRVRTGAFVRELPTVLYPIFIGGLLLVAAWSTLSGLRQWLDLRARIDQPSVSIADALRVTQNASETHEVAVSGVLALRPGAQELIAPFSKQPCLWFDRLLNFSNAKSRSRLVSPDLFVVQDASGSIMIDPAGFRVDTRHSNVTLGQSRLGYKRVKPTIEDRLHVGDRVYVRGTLSPLRPGKSTTQLLTAGVDQRSIIANIELPTLRATATRWFVVGVVISVLALAVSLWSMQQRAIASIPGVLT